MTRQRYFGSDVPFCKWLRANKTLPSKSKDCGFVATDTDLVVHRYLSAVDNIGVRDIQALMLVEIKTRNTDPQSSQMDTLRSLDLFKGSKHKGMWLIRNFGVSVLKMTGIDPDDSEFMFWGRFIGSVTLHWKPIDIAMLNKLLRFEIHPDSFEPKTFRRKHKTRTITETVITELGYEIEQTVVHRS